MPSVVIPVASTRWRSEGRHLLLKSLGKLFQKWGNALNPADPPKPPAQTIPAPAPGWVKALTWIGAIVLMVGGVLVLVGGRDLWINAKPAMVADPPTKKTTHTVKTAPKRSGKSRKPASYTHDTTTERAVEDSSRSESLAIAILATGAGLLLAGGFAARITSVKLPGVEVGVAAGYQAGVQQGVQQGAAGTAKIASIAHDIGRDDLLGDPTTLAEVSKETLARTEEEAEPIAFVPRMQYFQIPDSARFGIRTGMAEDPDFERRARELLEQLDPEAERTEEP